MPPPRFQTGVAAAAGAPSERDLGDRIANAFGFGSFDERTINPQLGGMYDNYLKQLQEFGQGGAEISAKDALDQAMDQQNRARAEAAYGRQEGALGLAQQAALGQVPSQAAIQGRQQLDQSMQQNIGLARSGGGASGMRAALYANAKSGQGAVADAAALRAQEMAAARGQYLQGTQGLSGTAANMRQQGMQRAGMDIAAQEGNRENQTRRQEGMLTGTGTTLGNITSTRAHDLDREAGFEGQQAPMGASTIGGVAKAGGGLIADSDPRIKMNIFPAGVMPSGMDLKQNFAPAGSALAAQTTGRSDQGMVLQGAASQLGAGNPLSQASSGSSAGYASPFQSSIDALNNAPQPPMGNVLGVQYSDPRAKMNAQPTNFPAMITSAIDSKSGLVPAGSTAPWGPNKEVSLGGPASIKKNIRPSGPFVPMSETPGAPASWLQGPVDTMPMPQGFLGGQAAWDKMGGAGQRDFMMGVEARKNTDAGAPGMTERGLDQFIRQDVDQARRRIQDREGAAAGDELAKKAAAKYGNQTEDTEDFMAGLAGHMVGKPGEEVHDGSLPAGLQGPRYTGQMAAEDFVAPTLTQATDTPPGQNPEAPKPPVQKGGLGSALSAYGEKVQNPAATFAATYSPLQLQAYSLGGRTSDPRAKQGQSEANSPIRDFEEKSKGFTYQYKDPSFEDGTAPPGTTHLGPMADDLRAVKGGIGETLTYEDPNTGLLGVNTGRLTLANAAAVNDLHERIKRLEAKRRGGK